MSHRLRHQNDVLHAPQSEGGGKGGERKIVGLLTRISEKGIEINDLVARANSPIKFVPPHGGNPADGYEATILPDICSVILKGAQKNPNDVRLKNLAERAEVLQHGFATLGIIGLVDEATGYQNVRARDALQAYLDRFLRKELAAWVKTFPDEFFSEMYRLKGWTWKGTSRRPGVVGHYVNDLIYDRLGYGVLDELQKRNPSDGHGRRKSKHTQWLTEDIGHPALAQHMYATIDPVGTAQAGELGVLLLGQADAGGAAWAFRGGLAALATGVGWALRGGGRGFGGLGGGHGRIIAPDAHAQAPSLWVPMAAAAQTMARRVAA